MREVKDILINKQGKWHSLKNSMIMTGSTWREFKTGSGIYHNGQWNVIKATAITVDVYISLSVAENREGTLSWHIVVSSSPDVLTMGDSNIVIEGTIFMSDTATYNILLTATQDSQNIDTHIPYSEGTEPSSVQLGATFTSSLYSIGEIHIL